MNWKALRLYSIICFIFVLSGCISLKPKPTVLLDEDMIYTVKAGTSVDVWLGREHLGQKVWNVDRKIVDASHIIRSEEIQDKKLLKKLGITKKTGWIGGSITSILGIIWFLIKRKKK